MNNLEYLKSLDIDDFAQLICFDEDGNQRGCCTICQRHKERNCDDRCLLGIYDWLSAEAVEQ